MFNMMCFDLRIKGAFGSNNWYTFEYEYYFMLIGFTQDNVIQFWINMIDIFFIKYIKCCYMHESWECLAQLIYRRDSI